MQTVKKYRWAPSLGEFEKSPQDVWGVTPYDPAGTEPVVFCGLYGLNDFHALWRYKGEKHVWWTGSDIRHLINGYWLDDKGDIRLSPKPFATWIRKNCTSWVENEVERAALAVYGIESNVVPSFLGDVNDFQVTYKHSPRPKVYTSVSGDDFKLYGWDKIDALAKDNPGVEFHLYGNMKRWNTECPNVIVHGRVPQEQFNKETEAMQGALRLTEFDGFSEIIAKSVLRGQYPVSLIEYPYMLKPSELHRLKEFTKPNEGRDYYIKALNAYPWAK